MIGASNAIFGLRTQPRLFCVCCMCVCVLISNPLQTDISVKYFSNLLEKGKFKTSKLNDIQTLTFYQI